MRIRQIVSLLLKFGVAGALIWFLLHKGLLDPNVLAQLLEPRVFAAGMSLIAVTLWLQAWRWQILLKARGFEVGLWQANKLYLIGTFFNYALPGAVGGDVVKAYYLVRDYPKRRMEAVLTVVIDRLMGLYATLAMALVAIGLDWGVVTANAKLKTLALGALFAFLLMTGFWAAAFSKRLNRIFRIEVWLQKMPMGISLGRAYKAAQAYGNHRLAFAATFVISMVALMISLAFMVLVGHTVTDENITLATYLFAVPLGFIASSLPIAPAGVGVGQVAFLVLFQMHSGHKTILGQTAITAFQAALLGWGLVGAVFYLFMRRPVSFSDEVAPS